MSTQNESPVADLMSDLGISSDESNPVQEEESNNTEENDLSDSDTATPDKDAETSETSEETDTAKADTDTTDELAEMKAEIEKLNKRITDKDKYINELRQQGKQETQEQEVSTEEDDSFFDDPEGKYKEMMQQLKIANLRIDEQAYASGKADYWTLVTPDAIQDGFRKDPTFMEEFNKSARPYETAYEFLSKQKKTEADNTAALKEQIRQEILKEMGVEKTKKQVPPNINSMGKSPSGVSEAAADGFSSVFG